VKTSCFILGLFFLFSCSTPPKPGTPATGKSTYSYTDVSGRFRLTREKKLQEKRIITRSQIIQSDQGQPKILENSITVSQIGSLKLRKQRIPVTRPLASDYTVWLEGKRHFSQMRLNQEKKSLQVNTEIEGGKKESSVHAFPQGRYFCFFSQLPECLYHNRLLERVVKGKQPSTFTMVWDAWPYSAELLTGAGKQVFSAATMTLEGEDQGQWRIEIEVDGQVILYYFSKAFDLVKIAWVAQGMTVVPLGEEAPIDDE
jgi:hypothetical protein